MALVKDNQFYYPINLHYSQTALCGAGSRPRFYYPINLHYSQTRARPPAAVGFYYPINLHYSQTYCEYIRTENGFYYPINLHYSQTDTAVGEITEGFTTL